MGEVEHRSLMRRAQAGCSRSLDRLIVDLTPMVERIASAFYFQGAGRDDVIQSGMMGLLSGIRSWDPDMGGQVEGFLSYCVRRHIITDVKFHQRAKHQHLNFFVSLTGRVAEHDDESLTFEEILPGGEDPALTVERGERLRMITGAIGEMTEIERTSVVAIADGVSYQQITARTGRSEKAIDNASQRARRKLKLLEAA